MLKRVVLFLEAAMLVFLSFTVGHDLGARNASRVQYPGTGCPYLDSLRGNGNCPYLRGLYGNPKSGQRHLPTT